MNMHIINYIYTYIYILQTQQILNQTCESCLKIPGIEDTERNHLLTGILVVNPILYYRRVFPNCYTKYDNPLLKMF